MCNLVSVSQTKLTEPDMQVERHSCFFVECNEQSSFQQSDMRQNKIQLRRCSNLQVLCKANPPCSSCRREERPLQCHSKRIFTLAEKCSVHQSLNTDRGQLMVRLIFIEYCRSTFSHGHRVERCVQISTTPQVQLKLLPLPGQHLHVCMFLEVEVLEMCLSIRTCCQPMLLIHGLSAS
eukprot:COSAG02_NODE_244_length_27402_cov_41.050397_13_plen_178_part_00